MVRPVLAFVTGFSSIFALMQDCNAQKIIENFFVTSNDQPSKTVQASHAIPGEVVMGDCTSCAVSCAPSCPDPHMPPLQVPPFEQPVGLRGCYAESCINGIDTADSAGLEQRWKDMRPLNFEPLGHGEWIGPVRLPGMLEYRLRTGDELQFIFVKAHIERRDPYRLSVGDELAIKSAVDENLKLGDTVKGVQIQPDGKLYPYLIQPVHAAGLTIEELRKVLEREYSKYLNTPAIDVLPIRTNTKVDDLNIAISAIQGQAGQNVTATVNPDGRIQLPMIGNVRVVGMTLEEIKREINLQYANRDYWGLEIEPRLIKQAPHFVFITGLVKKPGRVELNGPTTVMQALAMAEGVEVGGNLRQIVIFRRAEDWRLIATMVDVRGAMLAKRPNPADEIWVRDSDMIIVPPQPIKVFNNWVKLVFTDGIYGVAPAILFSNQQGAGVQ